jgi:enoyl-CoA hydratase/carnithine racemase
VSDVLARLADGVLEITLNRVRKRNALTAEMYDVLASQLEKASAADDVRVIVLTAEGADFCAGNDLQEFLGSYDLRRGTPWRRFLDSLPAQAKPLVAAVQGNAVGIGMTMLLHFDLVYLEPTARLSVPFGQLGVVPEAGSSGLLRMAIGPLRAGEAFLLGRALRAEEAVQLGLANCIVPASGGRQAALDAAKAIAQLPIEAVRQYRRLKQARYASLEDRIDAECEAFMRCLRTPETRSILSARAASSARRSGTRGDAAGATPPGES